MDRYLSGKTKVENATAAGLLSADKPIRQRFRLRRSLSRPPGATQTFKILQLVLLIALLVSTAFGLSMPIWAAFLSRPSLPFNGRTSAWLYFLSSAHAADISFTLIRPVIDKKVKLCQYTAATASLLCVLCCDFLWFTWFAFNHLVHYRPHKDLKPSFWILFFGPVGVCLTRLVLGPIFALHFNGHFSATKWKNVMVAPLKRGKSSARNVTGRQAAMNKQQALNSLKTAQSNKIIMSKNTEAGNICRLKKPNASQ